MPFPAIDYSYAKDAKAYIHESCAVDPDVKIKLEDNGVLIMEEGVSVMRGTSIFVMKDAVAIFRKNTKIGENTFVSIMCHLDVGEGCGISNMVDIHDHNHKDRVHENIEGDESHDRHVDSSGFESAPIIIEDGAVISNKVTLLAGVRVGQNSKIGANAVVSKSIPKNAIAVGSPAKVTRFFKGVIAPVSSPKIFKFGFYGTSIMEHLVAYSSRMSDQMNLPAVGDTVEVEMWKKDGYVSRLSRILTLKLPYHKVVVDNFGVGGATSRDIVKLITEKESPTSRYDILFLGCGINDVWRKYQERHDEAVGISEYEENFRKILDSALGQAHEVYIINETPVSGIDSTDQINGELEHYNEITKKIAQEFEVQYVDVYSAFKDFSSTKGAVSPEEQSLWSDGVHLSNLGDELMCQTVFDFLSEKKTIDLIRTARRYDSSVATEVYKDLKEFILTSIPEHI